MRSAICKIVRALIPSAVILAALLPIASPALDRVNWWYGEQPPSQWLDIQQKNTEYAFGQILWDLFGRPNTGGFFTNMSVVPQGSNMDVLVNPALGNSLMSLYQVGVADVNAYGGQAGAGLPTGAGDTPLPPDATNLYQLGVAASSIVVGPLPIPAAPNSQIDIIECQLQQVDKTPLTQNFVSSSNATSTGTVNRDRVEQINCQYKAGVAATSPTAPSVDSGWVGPVASVLVPNGVTAVTSGMITQGTGFAGFAQAGGVYVDTTTNQTIGGTKTFSNAIVTKNGIQLTGTPAPAATNQPYIQNDAQANPGIIMNGSASGQGVQFAANGTVVARIGADGKFHAGSTALGSTSFTLNGNATYAGLNPTLTMTQAGALIDAQGGALTLQADNDASNGIALNQTSGSATNIATFKLNGTTEASVDNTGSFLAGNNVQTGNTGYFVSSNLPVGQCLQVDSSHHIVGAGGGCGLSTGTITSVSGSGNITASTVSGSVTVGMLASPTFSTSTTAGKLFLGSDASTYIARTAGNIAVTGATFEDDNGFIAGNNQLTNTQLSMSSPGYFQPTGTSTSTTHYASNLLELADSQWNGSAAVTDYWQELATSTNRFAIRYNSGSTDLFDVDTSGNAATNGNMTVGDALSALSASIQGALSAGATSVSTLVAGTSCAVSTGEICTAQSGASGAVLFGSNAHYLDYGDTRSGQFTFTDNLGAPELVITNGTDDSILQSLPGVTKCGVGAGGLFITDRAGVYGPFMATGLSDGIGGGIGICATGGNIVIDGNSYGSGTCTMTGPGNCSISVSVNNALMCTANYSGATTPNLSALYPIEISGTGGTLTITGGTSGTGSKTLGFRYQCL